MRGSSGRPYDVGVFPPLSAKQGAGASALLPEIAGEPGTRHPCMARRLATSVERGRPIADTSVEDFVRLASPEQTARVLSSSTRRRSLGALWRVSPALPLSPRCRLDRIGAAIEPRPRVVAKSSLARRGIAPRTPASCSWPSTGPSIPEPARFSPGTTSGTERLANNALNSGGSRWSRPGVDQHPLWHKRQPGVGMLT